MPTLIIDVGLVGATLVNVPALAPRYSMSPNEYELVSTLLKNPDINTGPVAGPLGIVSAVIPITRLVVEDVVLA